MLVIRDISVWVLGQSSGAIGSGDLAFGCVISGTLTSGQAAALPDPTFSNSTVPAGNTIANTTTETAFTSSYTILANSLSADYDCRNIEEGVMYGSRP